MSSLTRANAITPRSIPVRITNKSVNCTEGLAHVVSVVTVTEPRRPRRGLGEVFHSAEIVLSLKVARRRAKLAHHPSPIRYQLAGASVASRRTLPAAPPPGRLWQGGSQ